MIPSTFLLTKLNILIELMQHCCITTCLIVYFRFLVSQLDSYICVSFT